MPSHLMPDSNGKVERKFSPRVWLGSDFFGWLRVMWQGRFRFHLPHLHIGVVTSCVTLGNTVLRYAQNALYRKQISQTRIEHAPIFIVGHWRTGTTLLHELLILDKRHTYPTTYQCLDPNHFLISEKLFKRLFYFLLPERRPMDNMQVGWERPQEDEFAMCMLGQPSPYLDLVFPNRPPLVPASMDLEHLPAWQHREWKRAFVGFLKALTLRDPRRLVLKSPPHSCRIKTLLELFPDARFVHIMRDPYAVFPSTVKLWKSLAAKHGVQTPHHRHVEEKVLSQFTQLYAKLEEGKRLVAPSRFHELKYEDLMANPIGQMRRLYERLELGGFEEVQPRLDEYMAKSSNYEKNRFQLTPAQRHIISQRWGDVIQRYGYTVDPQIPSSREPGHQSVPEMGSSIPAETLRHAEGTRATQQSAAEHVLR
jgi:omega-hydroxy-beta-dihydromenaquinone-9 sulfotransferase